MDVALAVPPPTPVLPIMDLAALARQLLQAVREDPNRSGLLETPERFARSMQFLCSGYEQTPAEAIGDALFPLESSDLVLVRDIEFYSLCEHHLLPFFGTADLAYVPAGRIVGLSKIPRLVDVYARRLQVQERLAAQVADAFMQVVQPQGVALRLRASHLCMKMRGVERECSSTETLTFRGLFHHNRDRRHEVLALFNRPDS